MCFLSWSDVADVIHTVAPVAPLALVIFGWFLVNRQNNRRESRKETRQLIDRAQGQLSTAVDLATKYQSGTCEDAERHTQGWKLLLALAQVSSGINTLERKGIDPSSCAERYLALKKCITGADFMTANWKPWSFDDKRWLELLAATNALSEAFEQLFIASFKD